jgi:sulfate adenylyltransferase large subunit
MAALPLAENPAQDFSIEEFLAAEQSKDLLRFSTAGSVDDGKSTLIGRLLYDSKNIYEDHVRSVTRTTGSGGASAIDFALLTDGLRAEREQGITIDVAYRYFSTTSRKFIIADTPGHEQYTRNMATGASTADLAIVLVDARKGILTQSRRHTAIAALLGIPRIVAAINKMDLVDFSREVFEQHRADLDRLAGQLGIGKILSIPISALDGDNVVHRSARTPWYAGPSLLEHLETVPLALSASDTGFRLPVQRVIRPHQHFRGFAGQIAAGSIRPGDEVVALPSGRRSRVASIATFDGDLDRAAAPQSVTLTLEDEIDISRGEMLAAADHAPQVASRFEASVVWLHADALDTSRTYLVKHTSQTVKARVARVLHRLDVDTLETHAADTLEMNAIGRIAIESSRPLFVDAYRENRITGSLILIDPATHATVGAGMIERVLAGASGPVTTPHPQHGAVLLVAQAQAAEVETKLLHSGYAVVRTRVQSEAVWHALLNTGVVALVESSDAPVPRFGIVKHGRLQFQDLADPSIDAITTALGSRGTLANFDDGGKA